MVKGHFNNKLIVLQYKDVFGTGHFRNIERYAHCWKIRPSSYRVSFNQRLCCMYLLASYIDSGTNLVSKIAD